MNRSALKKYAPQARLDFIEAVTLRARRLGLDPELPVRIEQTGDVLLIGGQPFPASVAKQRVELARRIQQQGFDAVVEALAYTWFNRLVAIRFMELKGYLSHGYRVLSHPEGAQPEILEHAQHLDLPGLDKEEVIRLKTAGNQDEALYREILLAQCHELHRNMPFLFEALDDTTELLLPDNLLRTDSLIARLVGDIEEGDWQEVEVIGWLYQFYISDKKDEVIGKVVKSEDIPAATQLFTPNWIVQYLVQNSLGRLWLMANPGSSLKEKMPYYIEPAEQTQEVQAQLDALIRVRMDEDGGTLNPESLTVLDPACGSGHILVEAYNLLRAIYEERGYRLRDIPRLILQKNLYGLDIDDRAAQLAGFALLMKAREDDRRLFDEEGNPPHLNVMAIQQSAGLPDEEISQVILNAAIQIEGGDAFRSGQLFGGGQLETQHSSGLTMSDLRKLIQLFEHGKTFGSLISVPDDMKPKLDKIVDVLATVRNEGDDLSRSYAHQVMEQFAWPACLLALKYDAVVANPPYMGSGGFNAVLKRFIIENYQEAKSDLYAAFALRNVELCKSNGLVGMITIPGWMTLMSFDAFRRKLSMQSSIVSFLHNGRGVFGSDFGSCAFCLQRQAHDDYVGIYKKLFSKQGEVTDISALEKKFHTAQSMFSSGSRHKKISGEPIAYWASDKVVAAFSNNDPVSSVAEAKQGLATGENNRFLRSWSELSIRKINLGLSREEALSNSQALKWFPYNKGGAFRKWFGNSELVVNWENDGEEIRRFGTDGGGRPRSRAQNTQYYFLESVSWSKVTIGAFSARYYPQGYIFDVAGCSLFFKRRESLPVVLGLLNSVVINPLLADIAQSVNFEVGQIASIPLPEIDSELAFKVEPIVSSLVSICQEDWDNFETSWGFRGSPLVKYCQVGLAESWNLYSLAVGEAVERVKYLEECNNRIFIEAYGLQDELSDSVSVDKITISRACREKDMQDLVSYAIGCLVGRYSLDEPGLVYANTGNIDFDLNRYRALPADEDGILPITEECWFEDDVAERVREFVKAVWGAEALVENMEWLADSLGRKTGESADEAIRRYLSTAFYKDHLRTYKKRPIYWLFSSGKQKAFECLVYLHRYNEGTLSRMRMEYVVPLQSRMQARIDKLTDDIDSATSSVQQKALQKRKDKLTKQLEELRRFDEKLRPYADQRITLDLDDGVKVNYGKFGDLLAEVKAITGGKED
ncbi:BREX-1 system adenine-specific DNA-methyltransferase PglX [Pseudomonas xionganensis]|uniref:site-specific DNA-methyltransferase (adenine-specific) n=1 Tax=Pseudomonas xionganensis TaxID=2654845 RepID=A0A6I4KWX6_9PSED|nr:BREX-1 system adenine-specific DNA-methyltransferase PglX [Pseudomonas xionganensis]MVW77189.1 BREX-1 system adenine-specific DNA-methyltransferase PglX [Pseudomonas xionganensis]